MSLPSLSLTVAELVRSIPVEFAGAAYKRRGAPVAQLLANNFVLHLITGAADLVITLGGRGLSESIATIIVMHDEDVTQWIAQMRGSDALRVVVVGTKSPHVATARLLEPGHNSPVAVRHNATPEQVERLISAGAADQRT